MIFKSDHPNFEKTFGARMENDADIRFSVPFYIEKQYNDYGWANQEGILYGSAYSQWKDMLSSDKYKPKAFDGSSIISVGEKFGIGNILVYTKGTYVNPKISKVVVIDISNNLDYDVDTDLECIRSAIYEYEKQYETAISIVASCCPEWSIREERAENSKTYREYAELSRAERESGGAYRNGSVDERRRTDGESIRDGENALANAKVKPWKSYESVAKIKEKIKYGFKLTASEKSILDSKGISYPAENSDLRFSDSFMKTAREMEPTEIIEHLKEFDRESDAWKELLKTGPIEIERAKFAKASKALMEAYHSAYGQRYLSNEQKIKTPPYFPPLPPPFHTL